MRIRQVALVARDLEPLVDDLRSVLGLGEPFRDPGVGEFGLHNAVLALGDQFLEVVSPVRDDATAARYLARRGGDGGYMVILQTADLDADRARLASLGVRIVWQIALPDIATLHLHPRDVGGAIVSLDRPVPPASWRWAGPGWEEKGARSEARGIAGVELASDDPSALARRWAAVLGREAHAEGDGAWRIALDGGALDFRGADDGTGDGVAALHVTARDPEVVRRRAAARGCVDARGRVRIGGVRFDVSRVAQAVTGHRGEDPVAAIARHLTADHARLEGLLDAATRREPFDLVPYAEFRRGLLRHIAIEEKLLLPAAQEAAGTPLPMAARLRLDHGAIAALLVPTPTPVLVATLRHILARHNPIEEDADGLYATCDALLAARVGEIVAAMDAYPEVPVSPHNDSERVMPAVERALERAGYVLVAPG